MAASQQTANYIPYPSDSDDVDIAGDMQLLANAVVGNKGNSTIDVVSPSVKGLQINASNTISAFEVNSTSSGNGIVVNKSGSGDAVRITNTGTGNSFVVEDSANPDATPFLIDNAGNIFINNSVTLSGSMSTVGSVTFVGNTTSSLVRITQEGSGDALLVEDSSNPDSSPFIVKSDGKVGIFTNNPDANLSVNGVASFGAGLVSTPSISAFGDLDTGIWFPEANTIAISTNATEKIRVNSSGNVGIGITPSTKLHVLGGKIRIDNATQTDNAVEIYDSATAHGGIGLSAWALGTGTTTDIAVKSEASKAIRFYTNGSNERAAILSNGLVGIGLSTPLYTLHLSSDGETDIALDSSTTSSSASYIIGRKSRGTAASPTAVLSGDHLLAIGAVGHNGTSYPSTYSGEIKISATENHSPTAQGGQISFFTVPNATTTQRQRFEIDQNGDLYINEITSATPLSTNIYTTEGTGTNIAGSDITLNAGKSTGSANGGTIHFKTSVAGVSGSSTNALVNRLSLGAASNLISAGTTTFAPLQFTSGTNLTTPVNGSVEYDGDKFYTTPNAGTIATTSGRGYIPSIHSAYTQVNSAAATTTTPVTPFTAANDTLPVDANKLYKFKGTYYATATWTSGAPAIQIGFTFSNAPANIKYRYRSYVIAAGTAISLQGQSTVATATTVTGTIGATNSFIIEFEGCFTSNATTGGTILPFFQMSTTGVSTVMTQCSQIEIQKLGVAGITTVAGNWA